MGELKQLREQQQTLIHRAKRLSNTLYLAGLGAYSKATNHSEALYQRYLEEGTQAYGDDAERKPALLLAGRGAVVSARKLLEDAPAKRGELYEQWIATGKQERGEDSAQANELVLAGIGAVSTLRQRSQRLFDDLVSTGEKESA
ncbi:hypothetical protein [Alloalcanivorax mobilis]|uniref:hypothetical protein n=1 Tax=Alloalcanivorax mobilis TaxID=2019569 RepID=UPI000B5B42FC|nr:hypothetical protein [Alloalcanivorax mobilis]ASK35094.1 hypothetical protein CEK62_12240 [Alcanivorax sp. N3-2A]|tara:strand:+ start:6387 stop:6818 length:432 start_codon:yes stop_codon:yes gene_type:complete